MNLNVQHLRASELAWQIEQLCAWGITLRQRGNCAGGVRARDMLNAADRRRCWNALQADDLHPHNGPHAWPARRLRALSLRAETHARSGHDVGCATLGLPLSLSNRLVKRWDGVGASRFLSEAVAEASTEIAIDLVGHNGKRGEWRADQSWEAVVVAMHRRITPRVASTEFPTEEWGRGV